jgi:pantoate--beta-alanine ligase
MKTCIFGRFLFMQIISSIENLKKTVAGFRQAGKSIGFVPTMGALHEGHISLLKECLLNDDISVVSIYVNPTQFNDKNDLKNYPRNFKADCDMLSRAGCHIVFAPDDREMYPEKDTRTFKFGTMGTVMEGRFRPGHFNGVAQIVTRLFDAVEPDRAYFGKKDFQQLAIVRKLISDLHYPLKIVGCPIIREADGLAMSSRNQLLSGEQRKAAPLIQKTLQEARERVGTMKIVDIEKFVEKTINSNPELKLEYFQFVDSSTLLAVKDFQAGIPVTACIAVFAGKIRLIDNVDIIS